MTTDIINHSKVHQPVVQTTSRPVEGSVAVDIIPLNIARSAVDSSEPVPSTYSKLTGGLSQVGANISKSPAALLGAFSRVFGKSIDPASVNVESLRGYEDNDRRLSDACVMISMAIGGVGLPAAMCTLGAETHSTGLLVGGILGGIPGGLLGGAVVGMLVGSILRCKSPFEN